MADYVIKFVSQYTHAETLVNGTLFMRPAMYYHYLEEGQGDKHEGAIDNSIDTPSYKGWSHPIYCMYYLDEKEIKDGKAIIPQKVISDFKCDKGYAVVIPKDQFMSLIPNKYEGSSVYTGKVKYGISTPLSKFLSMFDSTGRESLFLKRPVFSHQKEFRVTIDKQLFDRPNSEVKEKVYNCKLNGDFKEMASIIPVGENIIESGDLQITL